MNQQLLMNKKGEGMGIGNLLPIVLTFVVVVIGIGIGATIVENIQGDQTPNGSAYNASAAGLESLGTFSGWLPTIALVIAAVIVIGVVMMLYRKE